MKTGFVFCALQKLVPFLGRESVTDCFTHASRRRITRVCSQQLYRNMSCENTDFEFSYLFISVSKSINSHCLHQHLILEAVPFLRTRFLALTSVSSSAALM